MEKPKPLKSPAETKAYKLRKDRLSTHTKDGVSETGILGSQVHYTDAEPNDAHWSE